MPEWKYTISTPEGSSTRVAGAADLSAATADCHDWAVQEGAEFLSVTLVDPLTAERGSAAAKLVDLGLTQTEALAIVGPLAEQE